MPRSSQSPQVCFSQVFDNLQFDICIPFSRRLAESISLTADYWSVNAFGIVFLFFICAYVVDDDDDYEYDTTVLSIHLNTCLQIHFHHYSLQSDGPEYVNQDVIVSVSSVIV